YRKAVLEREAAVAGNVVGVRVRLENGEELDVPALALVQIRLDRIRRIDENGASRLAVADEVGSTPQVVVDELLEEHEGDRSNQCGYISGSEVLPRRCDPRRPRGARSCIRSCEPRPQRADERRRAGPRAGGRANRLR